MDSTLRTTGLMTAFVLVAVACSPNEDRMGQMGSDTLNTDLNTATRVDLQQVRSDVDSIATELRAELEAMRGEVREDRVDRWAQVSTDVEETRLEVMEDLQRVDPADRAEAQRVRDRSSERLAGIEGDVAREEIESTNGAQTLQDRVDQHVERLQSDLGYVQDQFRQYHARDRNDERWFNFTNGLDENDVADWQEELVEIRTELRERTAERDDVDDIASDLGDRIADLTRDIREHVHNMRWDENDRAL